MASRTQYELEILLGARQATSFRSNIRSAENALHGMESTVKKVAGVATAAFAAIGIKEFVSDSVGTFSEFEKSLDSTAATFEATESEYAQLSAAARNAGKETVKTATESSEALGYMALAGWDVNESTQNLMPILKTSVASNLDLAETSDLVTDSVNALSIPLKKLPEYLDTVVKGNDSANMTSQEMMQSFILSGGAARTLGIGYQDLGTAIGVLADNGTKGKKAGTAMNAIITRIASNDRAIVQMQKLGISIFDTHGKFIGFEKALKRINKGISGLTMEEQAVALKNIAGTEYYSKFEYLLEAVKKGAKGAQSAWDELEEDLESSDGALERKYDRMTDNLDGHVETMKSAFADMQISIGDAFDGELVYIVDELGEVFNDLSENITEFADENEIAIHNFVEGTVEGIGTAAEYFGEFAGFVMENGDYIIAAVEGLAAAFAAEKLVGGIMNLGMSLTSFFSNPIGVAVVGAAALTAGIVGIGQAMKVAHDRAVQANLEKHFGDISLSLEDIDEISQQIVGKNKLGQITEMLEAMGETSDSLDNMSDSFSKIESIEWKIDAGLKLDGDDKDKYISSIKSFMDEAQNIIDSKGYSVSLATKVLLGNDSKLELENNEFYAGLDEEMNRLENKLNKKIKKAVKNGINIDTDEEIQKLLDEISEITNAITESENQAALDTLELKYSGKDLNDETFKEMSKDIAKYEKEISKRAEEAYSESMTSLNARLKRGDIDQSQYDEKKQEYQQGYYQTRAESYLSGYDFMMNTIQDAYPELESALSDMNSKMDAELSKVMNEGLTGESLYDKMYSVAENVVYSLNMDSTTADAVLKVFESGASDVFNELSVLKKEMSNAGVDVPEDLEQGIELGNTIRSLSGNADDVLYALGDKVGNSPEYTAMIDTARKAGGSLPEGIAEGIYDKTGDVKRAINTMYNSVKNSSVATLYEGTVKISTSMAKNAISSGNAALNLKSKASTYTDKNGKQHTVYRNALGGIYDNEIFTTVSEEGRESIIPWNNSPRSKALLKQTAEGMGYHIIPKGAGESRDALLFQSLQNNTSGASNSSTGIASVSSAPVFTYSPKVIIQGNADQETITKALDISKERFSELMEQWISSKNRVKFG